MCQEKQIEKNVNLHIYQRFMCPSQSILQPFQRRGSVKVDLNKFKLQLQLYRANLQGCNCFTVHSHDFILDLFDSQEPQLPFWGPQKSVFVQNTFLSQRSVLKVSGKFKKKRVRAIWTENIIIYFNKILKTQANYLFFLNKSAKETLNVQILELNI